MELRNDFRVGVAPETAWQVLNDVERIAPCMPGAQLQEIEGREYRGIVKVKVGPITAQYKGKATFLEQDESAGRMVLKASGRDTGGGGNANATITATLVADAGGTRVTVVTDLAVTGKLAQFGRGVLAEVSTKLLGQFVDCLEYNVLAAGGRSVAPSASPPEAPQPPDAVSAHEPEASTPEAGPVPEASIAAPPPADDSPAAGSDPAIPNPADAAEAPPVSSTPAAQDPPEPRAELSAGTPADNGTGAPVPPKVRRVEGPDVAPVDLLEAAGSSLAKRALPPLAALVALVVALLVWRRWHNR